MGQVVTFTRMVVQYFQSYIIQNIPIYETLWVSSSIHHITFKRETQGLSSGGLYPTPTIGYRYIEGQIGYKMKQHCSERDFEVGGWVFLRLQPYKKMSLKQQNKDEYYGPYNVLKRIGKMDYRLELPPSSHVYSIFCVSCLKKVIIDNILAQTILLELNEEGKFILVLESTIETRIKLTNG
jgi:hypothetical protein